MLVLTFRPVGGLEIYTRQVAAALRRLGHDIEVWSVLEAGPGSAPDGIRLRHLAPRPRPLRSAHHRVLSWRVTSLLRREHAGSDLVLAMHPMLAVGTHRALSDGQTPYWVWTYGTDIWGDWDPALERALEGASKIGTISRFTAARIWARLPEADIPVVYPTVSVEQLLEVSASEPLPDYRPMMRRPTLLTVSRISSADAFKGHDKVMAALPLIERGLGREVEYRVVGEGDALPRLKALAAELGVEERVRFLGRLDEAALVEEFRACDLFVMPSRTEPAPGGSYWGEGFGIVYIEASAAGKPVVASTQAAAPETIRDGVTGFAADPCSEEAIAEACARILSSPELGRRMGEEGRRFVASRFGREAFDRRLAEALEA